MRLYRRGKSKCWTVALNYKGKRYVVSTRCTNKSLALEWAHRFETSLRFGSYRPDEESVTFERLAELARRYYVVNGRKSLKTLGFVIKRLARVFGGMRAIDISTERVEKYKAQRLGEGLSRAVTEHTALTTVGSPSLRTGAAKSTINVELSALSLMFRLATEQGIISKRPVIKYLSVGDNSRQGFVSPGDYLAIREHLPACLADLTDFLWWTGLRISTGRMLEWRDVSDGGRNAASVREQDSTQGVLSQPREGSGTIRIRSETTKTQTPHEIPIAGALAEVISRATTYRTLRTPFVFHRDGKPLLLKWCEENWKRAARKVGLAHIIIHDLRRSFVRNMRLAGMSEATIMSFTGHRSRSVFSRYNITDLDEKTRALERMEQYLGGQSKESSVRRIK